MCCIFQRPNKVLFNIYNDVLMDGAVEANSLKSPVGSIKLYFLSQNVHTKIANASV